MCDAGDDVCVHDHDGHDDSIGCVLADGVVDHQRSSSRSLRNRTGTYLRHMLHTVPVLVDRSDIQPLDSLLRIGVVLLPAASSVDMRAPAYVVVSCR